MHSTQRTKIHLTEIIVVIALWKRVLTVLKLSFKIVSLIISQWFSAQNIIWQFCSSDLLHPDRYQVPSCPENSSILSILHTYLPLQGAPPGPWLQPVQGLPGGPPLPQRPLQGDRPLPCGRPAHLWSCPGGLRPRQDLQQEDGLLHQELPRQTRSVRYDRCVSITITSLITKHWSLVWLYHVVSCCSPSCHSSWQTLRQSPIFGCICPNNLPNKKKCDKIFKTVNGNDCIGKCLV